MWNNFCAVIEDLFWFAVSSLGITHVTPQTTISPYQYSLPPRPFLTPILFDTSSGAPPQSLFTSHSHSTQPVARTLPLIPAKTKTLAHIDAGEKNDPHQNAANILHAPVVMYVNAPQGSPCIYAPHMDFDGVIDMLTYGTAVTVIGYQGRYASVNRSNITGWISKDDLTPQKNEVWPEFVSGVLYDVDHLETKKTRLLIHDTFGAGALQLPLQAGEYISVRLASEHRQIPWTKKRPRVAGSWANLLRGVKGIYIGVTPKTDSIMEYQSVDGEGRLGYVEAVTPELAITITAIGEGESGRYTVKTMSAEIWRELRPVFIEVT